MLLTTVLDFYGNKIDGIQYPQKEKIEKYIPTPEEVTQILLYFKDTRFYVPIFLGVRGLRLSEVCALTPFDLKGTTLTINKAKVRGGNGYSLKKPKTTDSERSVVIPEEIAERIRQQGYIYEGAPHIITRNLQRCLKDLGIPQFTFHQFRHFFASYAHYLGFVDKAIQDDAGWKTDNVMKETYRQSMSKSEISKAISDSLAALIS
jgi:integrase